MSGVRQRAMGLAAGVLVLIMGAGGSAAAGAGAAARPVTNLQLLAGTDPDFPPRQGARALSASPVFAVTGASLELDVRRTGGVVSVRQGGVLLPVRPRSVLLGLPRYFQWKLLRTDGGVAASAQVEACPMSGTLFGQNAWGFNMPVNIDPANPDTPATNPYPLECGDPLTVRARWGFPTGWGVQMHIQVPDATPPGAYMLEATVNPDGAIRESTRADNTVRMPVEVFDTGQEAQAVAAPPAATERTAVPRSVPPTAARAAGGRVDLPDLVPLPSENISAVPDDGVDLLRFSSTVANLGRGTMRIDGFRSDMTATEMRAEQVLFRDGAEVSRRPAGTLVYDPEHFHWHFDYLARYQLVDARGTVVATSGKIGFCMADVHQIDAGNPAFALPDYEGFTGCGTAVSRSVRETLDPGWGDEYGQIRPGQALDISGIANGTYQLRIEADPEHKLQEATRDNNISHRTVILGGTAGARTVQVPPIDGVDTEAAWAALGRTF
ncbi:hypothetical protein Q0Z83_027020 [Actinoplanes sichuanensis]|uniref:Lysyl oxidase family protein n=1 Tax=Actinoplanes sichuanensis TaxID=512349 RepID=A0ABW4AVG6_9ACTN|nr:lysyl oxidase family protein [Actinoplanes sichuanensis]BEL04511.1 hypothetical protein Q0Z83_027020 [Actinoplanes sichuanensis]